MKQKSKPQDRQLAAQQMREFRAVLARAEGREPGVKGRPRRQRCNAGHDLKEDDNRMPWGECKTCYELAHQPQAPRKRCKYGHVRENNMPWGECRTCYELAHPNPRGRPRKDPTGKPLVVTKALSNEPGF